MAGRGQHPIGGTPMVTPTAVGAGNAAQELQQQLKAALHPQPRATVPTQGQVPGRGALGSQPQQRPPTGEMMQSVEEFPPLGGVAVAPSNSRATHPHSFGQQPPGGPSQTNHTQAQLGGHSLHQAAAVGGGQHPPHGAAGVPHSQAAGQPTPGAAGHPQGAQQQQQQQIPAQPQGSAHQQPVNPSQLHGDRFGLTGLLSVIRMTDADLNALALGFDLTTLGLNLNSPDYVYTTFCSPWSDTPVRVQPEYKIPQCYFMNPPHLRFQMFQRFQLETLFYIFYSMPCDVLQLAAAQELYNREWRYHKEKQLWFTRTPGVEPSVKTPTFEKGSYLVFHPDTWTKERVDDFTLVYAQLEDKTTAEYQAQFQNQQQGVQGVVAQQTPTPQPQQPQAAQIVYQQHPTQQGARPVAGQQPAWTQPVAGQARHKQ
eukprot:TRINITY_DN66436_c2_g1_i1.p1 TRINITY_DN66436_c2_g1~~TRINITY_DN66436_c2_g1_i1.p1  ORF type:complete len:434 (+),score=72.04 TRINITY_DN66436_c2_g1_i1:25-1302(+)